MNRVRKYLIGLLLGSNNIEETANTLSSQALVYLVEQISKNAQQYNREFFAQKISEVDAKMLAECVKVNRHLTDLQKLQIVGILETPRPPSDTINYLN